MKANLRALIGLVLALAATTASAGPFTVGLEKISHTTTAVSSAK